VVQPRADDPGRDAPHGDAQDQIGVAFPPAPAPARQVDGGDDRDEERQPVGVNRRQRAGEIELARGRRRDAGEHGGILHAAPD
jgi:hypothetical protein